MACDPTPPRSQSDRQLRAQLEAGNMPSNDLSHLIPAGAEVLEFSTAAVQDKWDPIAYQRHAQREKKKDVRVGCACVMLLPGGCSLRAARPGQGGCTAVQFTDAPGGDCVPDKPYCEAQAPDPHPCCTGTYTLRTRDVLGLAWRLAVRRRRPRSWSWQSGGLLVRKRRHRRGGNTAGSPSCSTTGIGGLWFAFCRSFIESSFSNNASSSAQQLPTPCDTIATGPRCRRTSGPLARAGLPHCAA